jgi:hypothetical protein
VKRLLGGAFAVAVLSLLWSRQPTYDPYSWLIWGREIVHGTLSTTTGPSWKPLPVLLTTPFSLAGEDVAPVLWVVVARMGAVIAVVMTYRLAARLGGMPAGIFAAVALVISSAFLRNAALGNSEGLLVAFALGAVDRHLDGHRGQAFALGFAAALLRPEVWLVWGPYGLWLGWRDPTLRVGIALAFAAVPVLWLVPEWLGSGNPFRAADRAREPLPNSPAFADHPWIEVLHRAVEVVMVPVLVLAVVALATRRRAVLWLGAATLLLVAIVALMTEAGFSGNLRYLELPAALVCVMAGAGFALLARRGALVAALLVVVAVAFAISPARTAGGDLDRARAEGQLYETLPDALALAGGRGRVMSCGPIYTGMFEVPPLVWRLRNRLEQVTIFPRPPGIVIASRGVKAARDPRFPPVGRTERWVVRRRCVSSATSIARR